ncbi:NAD-dependent epimerase, partial [Vibrio xuii]
EGSKIVYFTAGLPIDTAMWVEQWPIMMRNVINACAVHNAKLVYFDNTYIYPQTNALQTEESRFEPHGEKGKVRGLIAKQLLDAISEGRVQAMICRAPEF